jgi:predicted RNA-binding Zn-ribbon protein involved in translation (DUF1610 family)
VGVPVRTSCPDCGREFGIPNRDVWWLADAKNRNPSLKIICPKCGKKEVERLEKQKRSPK